MRSKAGRGRRRSMGYERSCSKSIMIVFNLLQLLTLRINYLQLQIKQFIKCLWFYNSSVKFGQSVVYQTISTVIWPSIMTAIYQPVTAAIGPSIIAAIYETINTAIRPSIIAAVFYLFCSFYFGKSFSPIFDPACTSKSSSFLVKQANIKNIITGTHCICSAASLLLAPSGQPSKSYAPSRSSQPTIFDPPSFYPPLRPPFLWIFPLAHRRRRSMRLWAMVMINDHWLPTTSRTTWRTCLLCINCCCML